MTTKVNDEITRARMKLEALISRDAAKAIDALIQLRLKESNGEVEEVKKVRRGGIRV